MQEGEAPVAPPHRDREPLGGEASEVLPLDEKGATPPTTIEWNKDRTCSAKCFLPFLGKGPKGKAVSAPGSATATTLSSTSLRKSPSSQRGLLALRRAVNTKAWQWGYSTKPPFLSIFTPMLAGEQGP